MKQKTVKLGDGYRINDDETVDAYGYLYTDDEGKPVYGWEKTKYKIGERVMLVSQTNVSPNAIRNGYDIPRYSLVFDCPDGIPGNSNQNITRYHGWRGTNNDVSYDAHGLRKIIKMSILKNGQFTVTVGPDLFPGLQ